MNHFTLWRQYWLSVIMCTWYTLCMINISNAWCVSADHCLHSMWLYTHCYDVEHHCTTFYARLFEAIYVEIWLNILTVHIICATDDTTHDLHLSHILCICVLVCKLNKNTQNMHYSPLQTVSHGFNFILALYHPQPCAR